MQIHHIPVLLKEVVATLNVHPGGRYIDCTLGTGGHAAAILERCQPEGRLLGFDQDPAAVEQARERLAGFGKAATLSTDDFEQLEAVAAQFGFTGADGILFDLGVSSLQLGNPQRGFSFQQEGPLDMRMDPQSTWSAADVVNSFSERDLADLIWHLGEEREARRIAKAIVAARPLRTTWDLAHTVVGAVRRHQTGIHPATRTFQALRIFVNRELEKLELALQQALKVLGPGGRLVVISFHSLEDRLVKEFLRRESKGCLCPPTTPVCICNHQPQLRLVHRKVLVPSAEEIAKNPRSRSAKLRAAERL